MDLPRLEDARNKLRTQIHDARSQSGFNENLENETLTQAQWMLDAINSEIIEREEFISDPHQATVEEAVSSEAEEILAQLANDEDWDGIYQLHQSLGAPGPEGEAARIIDDMYSDAARELGAHADDDFEGIYNQVLDHLISQYGNDDSGAGETDDNYALASAGFGSDEDYGSYGEDAPPTAKGERMVKHIKAGYAKDGKLTPKEKSIAYATAWKQHNKDTNESVTTGEEMTRLNEGEIQQASAIVNAKTMVDRVGRWIEELSGMENDTLLQLGDSIRDEMSADLAKQFISACAPAIQSALQNLKDTRETLSSGVRMLTGEEQGAEMLGAEPGADLGDELGGDEFGAEPDAMNAAGELDNLGEPGDEFGASDAAAGGLGDAGRAQRESIDRSNNLLRILAG